MNIPGIHSGNRAPTLAVKRTQGKLPEAQGQLHPHKVPGAAGQLSSAPSRSGLACPGVTFLPE